MASSTDPPLVSSALLAGERVTFTGTLASMTHRQASALVEERGGLATEHVSRQTTLLVIGEEGWPLEPDGMPSLKLQQALRWQLAGQSLRILRESEWLSVLGLTEAREEMTRLYTPAMLSQMLGLSVATIRRWAHLGLIRAARVVYRLPYFSFAEVAGVRRLSELVDAGVGIAEIGKSLEALRALFPDIDRPLAQLELLGRRLVPERHFRQGPQARADRRRRTGGTVTRLSANRPNRRGQPVPTAPALLFQQRLRHDD